MVKVELTLEELKILRRTLKDSLEAEPTDIEEALLEMIDELLGYV